MKVYLLQVQSSEDDASRMLFRPVRVYKSLSVVRNRLQKTGRWSKEDIEKLIDKGPAYGPGSWYLLTPFEVSEKVE